MGLEPITILPQSTILPIKLQGLIKLIFHRSRDSNPYHAARQAGILTIKPDQTLSAKGIEPLSLDFQSNALPLSYAAALR